jgi:hypothetical protein
MSRGSPPNVGGLFLVVQASSLRVPPTNVGGLYAGGAESRTVIW